MRINANPLDPEGERDLETDRLPKTASDPGDGDGAARSASRAGAEPAQGRGDSEESGRTRKSPSNRRDLPPSDGVLNTSVVGIDRLSVSFPVEDYDPNPDHWDSHSERHKQGGLSPWLTYEELHPLGGARLGTVIESHGRQVEIAGIDVFVGVQVVAVDGIQKTVYGKIEYNPARLIDPQGYGLASVHETVSTFQEVVIGIDFLVAPMFGDDLSSYRVKRIDVARDFHSIRSTSALLRGLSTFPRKHARKNFVHADPSLGGAQTLTVGSKAGLVRLYDKFAHTKGAAKPGTVRWEAEARAWAKSYGGIKTVADVTDANAMKLALDRWHWSAMGSEVVLYLDVGEIAKRLGIKESEASTFYGWVVDHGISSGWTPSATTLSKYRGYQRELGIAFGLEVFLANAVSVRLDWDSGTEIIRMSEES